MSRAVVLGGGFAGVLSASVLRKHMDEVITIDNDQYPFVPSSRRGLPQSLHCHILVTGGARALEQLLPGTMDALLSCGAQKKALPGDALILTSVGWFSRLQTESYLISCSRGLIDHIVRQKAALPVQEQTRALGLIGDATRVTGVRIMRNGNDEETIQADLVIDATGRGSKATQWLAELGVPEIEELNIDSEMASSTRIYKTPTELISELPAIMIHPSLTKGRLGQGATLFPIENDQFIVTLTCTSAGKPPIDEYSFSEFARSLPDGIVSELMEGSKPVSDIRPYCKLPNRRRFFERTKMPVGFIAIGDAVVSVHPSHSHGLSVAALSVLKMDEELTHRGIQAGLQASIVAEAEKSWQLAIPQDVKNVRIEGSSRREMFSLKPDMRYRMMQSALSNQQLADEFFKMDTLISSDTPSDKSALIRAILGKSDPLLSTEEAIMQYPPLADWRLRRTSSSQWS